MKLFFSIAQLGNPISNMLVFRYGSLKCNAVILMLIIKETERSEVFR